MDRLTPHLSRVRCHTPCKIADLLLPPYRTAYKKPSTLPVPATIIVEKWLMRTELSLSIPTTANDHRDVTGFASASGNVVREMVAIQ